MRVEVSIAVGVYGTAVPLGPAVVSAGTAVMILDPLAAAVLVGIVLGEDEAFDPTICCCSRVAVTLRDVGIAPAVAVVDGITEFDGTFVDP